MRTPGYKRRRRRQASHHSVALERPDADRAEERGRHAPTDDAPAPAPSCGLHNDHNDVSERALDGRRQRRRLHRLALSLAVIVAALLLAAARWAGIRLMAASAALIVLAQIPAFAGVASVAVRWLCLAALVVLVSIWGEHRLTREPEEPPSW